MRFRTNLLLATGAMALGLMATGAAAQNGVYGTALPADGVPASNSSRPPAPETPPGDLTAGTAASQSPASEIGYQPPSAMTEEKPADVGTPTETSATVPDQMPAMTPNTVSMAPIPDTVENRRLYGGPRSHGGRATRPRGN